MSVHHANLTLGCKILNKCSSLLFYDLLPNLYLVFVVCQLVVMSNMLWNPENDVLVLLMELRHNILHFKINRFGIVFVFLLGGDGSV